MKNWKIAFWTCFTVLLLTLLTASYMIIDQGVTINYMSEGYSDTKKDLDRIVKIVNETGLTKNEVKNILSKDESVYFVGNTIRLQTVSLVFRNDKLHKVVKN